MNIFKKLNLQQFADDSVVKFGNVTIDTSKPMEEVVKDIRNAQKAYTEMQKMATKPPAQNQGLDADALIQAITEKVTQNVVQTVNPVVESVKVNNAERIKAKAYAALKATHGQNFTKYESQLEENINQLPVDQRSEAAIDNVFNMLAGRDLLKNGTGEINAEDIISKAKENPELAEQLKKSLFADNANNGNNNNAQHMPSSGNIATGINATDGTNKQDVPITAAEKSAAKNKVLEAVKNINSQ